MRTKLIATALAGVLALGGVACGESATTTNDGSSQTGVEQDGGSGGSGTLDGGGSDDGASGSGSLQGDGLGSGS